MPEEKILPKDRIVSSFKHLNAISGELNAAIKELNKPIGRLEFVLKDLNLGVSAWHQIAGSEDENGSYWSRDIGYTRIGQDWRIALRHTSGHHNFDDSHSEEIFPFSDGQRWMCVEAAGKLPDLIDTLIKRALDTTEKIKARIPEVEELVAAVETVKAELRPAPPIKRAKLNV